MNEEPEQETRPRVLVTPLLDALEYDAAFHLHRGQPPAKQNVMMPPEAIPKPRVLPWRSYLRAQGRQVGTAVAGSVLILVGILLVPVGLFCIGKDISVYSDCQPKPNPSHIVGAPVTSVYRPIGNLPAGDLAGLNEETTHGKSLPDNWELWTMLHIMFFPLSYGYIRVALFCIRRVRDEEPVIPLTSANTGHLPAAESLVRASEQFVSPPQSVLLRAVHSQTMPEQMLRPAVYSEEKLPEQLVHPVGGQE